MKALPFRPTWTVVFSGLIIACLTFPAAEGDHKDADCFACVILSHGDEGVVYGTNGTMRLDRLTANFKGDICPDLRGKPKLFFIQVPPPHANLLSHLTVFYYVVVFCTCLVFAFCPTVLYCFVMVCSVVFYIVLCSIVVWVYCVISLLYRILLYCVLVDKFALFPIVFYGISYAIVSALMNLFRCLFRCFLLQWPTVIDSGPQA